MKIKLDPERIVSEWGGGKPTRGGRRASHSGERMNKLERAWADKLELRRRSGAILSWQYEALKLRLARATFYTPDFLVLHARGGGIGVELHEVKGHWEDDARVKIKVAADLFPEFHFSAIQRKRGGGGDWSIERVGW